jgi:hypothetical protein
MSIGRPNLLYLISLTMMMTVAIVVFPSAIHYGYSQKSGNGIYILGSSSHTSPNEDDESNYHVVGEVKNNSPTDTMNNVKIVSTFYDNTGKIVGTDFTCTT